MVRMPEQLRELAELPVVTHGDDEVAIGIADHYSPKGPNDTCPSDPVSIVLALAEKIDTLVGFFAIGEKPTGSKDPFALRRAALGIIRLILENNVRIDLYQPIIKSVELYKFSSDGSHFITRYSSKSLPSTLSFL